MHDGIIPDATGRLWGAFHEFHNLPRKRMGISGGHKMNSFSIAVFFMDCWSIRSDHRNTAGHALDNLVRDHAHGFVSRAEDAEADIGVVDEWGEVCEWNEGGEGHILQFPFRSKHAHLRIGLPSAYEREVYGCMLVLQNCRCFEDSVDALQGNVASVKEHFERFFSDVLVVWVRAKEFRRCFEIEHGHICRMDAKRPTKKVFMRFGIDQNLVCQMAVEEV